MRPTRIAKLTTAAALSAALATVGGAGIAAAVPTACDPNAPGSCDKYDPHDPFVPGGNKVGKAPAHTIVMADFAFTPTKITAKPGETWTEDNRDIAIHNISSENYLNKHKKGTGADIAPDVAPGSKATFKMPTKPGKYKVVCFYHQNMTATITIKK
ncbi:MAG TPA: cupredoxin domain-containing protein [Sporichthyaceae bacterium]|nr:cupredoxin domain-containing protein [Sporichthyaceae bacterium]